MWMQAHVVRSSETGVAGAVDVDVVARLSTGLLVEGEVTLVRDHEGSWVAYGPSPDYWVSGELLRAIEQDEGGGPGSITGSTLTQLEEVAAAAARRLAPPYVLCIFCGPSGCRGESACLGARFGVQS